MLFSADFDLGTEDRAEQVKTGIYNGCLLLSPNN